MSDKLTNKDLLGLRETPVEDMLMILETAKEMKQIVLSQNKKASHLQGKSIVSLFYENSTRTRMSFELASKYLGGVAANISASASSVSKGETLIDTGRTLDVMGTDVIIMRHNCSGAPHLLAKHVEASVINAGDGMNEHPTQGLLDMFTMIEAKGNLKGKKVAIVGDILHSRVVRSNIWGLNKLGAHVSVAGPQTLMPSCIEDLGVKAYNNVEGAIEDADVVMGLRIQQERQNKGLFPSVREYSSVFGINDKRLSLAKPDALLLHPGPVNRGVEITSSIMDGDQSLIDTQVLNGVAVRMAILYLVIRRGSNE
ncbi:MAG: aspartate carbamoyltransferase catalytic subunit [Bacillota bacterium]